MGGVTVVKPGTNYVTDFLEKGLLCNGTYGSTNYAYFQTGDFVVRTDASAAGASGYNVIRPLLKANTVVDDIAAFYENAARTQVNGILGVCYGGVTQTTTGVPSSDEPYPVTRVGNYPIRKIPGLPGALQVDTVSGRGWVQYYPIRADTILQLALSESAAITSALIGDRVGFTVSYSSNRPTYKVSNVLGTAVVFIATIVDVPSTQPLYNTTAANGIVHVRIDGDYCQTFTGNNYST